MGADTEFGEMSLPCDAQYDGSSVRLWAFEDETPARELLRSIELQLTCPLLSVFSSGRKNVVSEKSLRSFTAGALSSAFFARVREEPISEGAETILYSAESCIVDLAPYSIGLPISSIGSTLPSSSSSSSSVVADFLMKGERNDPRGLSPSQAVHHAPSG